MGLWDPVETSGLPDDIDFTIAKANFGYDAGYANGEQLLFIIEAAETDPEGEPYRSFYSVGRAGAWETLDHGATVVSQSNPPAEGFNKQSLYWKFIEAALGTPAGAVIQGRGTPDKAAIWEGLKFHMNRVDVDYGGEIGTKKALLPTTFLGEVPKADAPAAAAPAPAEPVAPASDGAGATPPPTNILEAKVKALVHSADSHDKFIEAVMEKYPEASNDPDLFGRVLDEKGGLWAEVKG